MNNINAAGDNEPLDGKDLRSFLQDKQNNILQLPLNPKRELSKNGRIVWVENSLTNDFSPLIIKNKNVNEIIQSNLSVTKSQDNQNFTSKFFIDDDEYESSKLIPSKNIDFINSESETTNTSTSNSQDLKTSLSIEKMKSIYYFFYFFVQGILFGFSFSTFYLQIFTPNDTNFLNSYQPIAAATRLLFYLLSTFSLLGSLHILVDTWEKSYSKSYAMLFVSSTYDSILVLSLLSVICYLIVFILSLLMSQTDTKISLHDGYGNIPMWTQTALNDNSFK